MDTKRFNLLNGELTKHKGILGNSTFKNSFFDKNKLLGNSIFIDTISARQRLFSNSAFKDIFSARQSILNNSVLRDAITAQKNILENSAFKDIISAQKSILSNSAFRDAITAQKSILESSAFKDVLSAQKSILNSSAFSGALSNHKSIIGATAIKNTASFLNTKTILSDALSLQKSILSNSTFNSINSLQKSLFSDSLNVKVSNTYRNLMQNHSYIDSTALTKAISKYKLSDEKIKEFSVDGDAIVIDNNNYQLEELRGIISNIIDESGINDTHALLSNSLDKIFQMISDINNSSIRSIIYNTIISLFISVLTVIYTPKLNEISENIFRNNNKPIIKKIERVSHNLPASIKDSLRQLRFVAVDNLNVRIKPSQKSKLIGKIYLGDIVTIIQKKKNWSLVELLDIENNITIKGWVFTRYIKNFK